MASNVFGAKKFNPVPPEKGAFPLDHHGECRQFFVTYMNCLRRNNHESAACRDESKDYLGCRMEKGLMVKEEWNKLGFETSSFDEDKIKAK